MAEVGAHITDHVLPHVPVRQWVLSLPDHASRGAPCGPSCTTTRDIAGAVLRIFVRAIRTTLCRMSPGAPRDAKLGAISFLHRFGAALNTHFHFHLVVLDGAFSRGPDGVVRFHEATLLQPLDCLELQRVVQRRVLRYFRTHSLLDEADAHGMLSWQGSGGFSIDASVRIQGDDREGVERLLYRFPKPTPDGRTQILLSPLQLLERLAEFVPPGTDAKRGRGGEMKILAFLTDPPVVAAILLHLELPHRPPSTRRPPSIRARARLLRDHASRGAPSSISLYLTTSPDASSLDHAPDGFAASASQLRPPEHPHGASQHLHSFPCHHSALRATPQDPPGSLPPNVPRSTVSFSTTGRLDLLSL